MECIRRACFDLYLIPSVVPSPILLCSLLFTCIAGNTFIKKCISSSSKQIFFGRPEIFHLPNKPPSNGSPRARGLGYALPREVNQHRYCFQSTRLGLRSSTRSVPTPLLPLPTAFVKNYFTLILSSAQSPHSTPTRCLSLCSGFIALQLTARSRHRYCPAGVAVA